MTRGIRHLLEPTLSASSVGVVFKTGTRLTPFTLGSIQLCRWTEGRVTREVVRGVPLTPFIDRFLGLRSDPPVYWDRRRVPYLPSHRTGGRGSARP